MKPVHFTPKAVTDIRECAAWIRKENPAVALRFLEATRLAANTVSQMPGIGSRRYADLSLMPGIRMIKVKGFEHYLLFYLEREDRVDIIRVLHSARNIPQALREPE
jgi:toxin ParE1/3/4